MAGSSNIRAGRAYVEISADRTALDRGLTAASARLRGWADSVKSLGNSLMLSGGALTGAFAFVTRGFAESGAELAHMSQRTGIGVEDLSALAFAAKMTGTDMTTAEGAIRRMQKSIAGVADQAEGTSGKLEDIGLTAADVAGKTPIQQFETISQAIGRIQDPTQRAAAAMSVFGRSGTMILPMIEDFARLNAMAKEGGFIKSAASVAEAKKLQESLILMEMSAAKLRTSIGSALAPAFADFATWVAKAVQPIREWIAEHKELVVWVFKVGAAIAGIGLVLGVFSKIAGAVSLAINAVKALITVMTFLSAHPLILILTAAVALAVVMDRLTTSITKLSSAAAEQLEQGNEQRAEDLGRMARLQELADKESRNAEEMKEAGAIVKTLTARYGDLGLVINEATGSIDGMTEAHKRLRKEMKDVALAQVNAAIAEAQANMAAIGRDMGNAPRGWLVDVTGGFGGLMDTTDKRLADLQGKLDVWDAKFKAALAQQKMLLQTADDAGLTGGKPVVKPVAPGVDLKDLAKQEEQYMNAFQHRQELEARLIEDKHKREMKLIDLRYDREIAKAKAAGATKATIDEMLLSKQAEVDALMNSEADTKRKADGQARERIEDLKLETTLRGNALKIAMLELEEKRAVAEATKEGLDIELVRQEFALRRKRLDQEAASAKDRSRGVVGLFNVAALFGIGGGVQDRIAVATEKTADNTGRLANRPAAGLAFR